MTKTEQIQKLALEGSYYLTEQAYRETELDELDTYDIENVLLSGRVRRNWPAENRYEVVGQALDERRIGVVFRLTPGGKARVVAVFRDVWK